LQQLPAATWLIFHQHENKKILFSQSWFSISRSGTPPWGSEELIEKPRRDKA
jgi:hypothetical protein